MSELSPQEIIAEFTSVRKHHATYDDLAALTERVDDLVAKVAQLQTIINHQAQVVIHAPPV